MKNLVLLVAVTLFLIGSMGCTPKQVVKEIYVPAVVEPVPTKVPDLGVGFCYEDIVSSPSKTQ